MSAGGVLNIPLSPKLMDSVRSASRRRAFFLDAGRKEDEAKKQAKKRKLQLENELHSIESESTKLLEQMKVLEDRAREIKAAKVNL